MTEQRLDKKVNELYPLIKDGVEITTDSKRIDFLVGDIWNKFLKFSKGAEKEVKYHVAEAILFADWICRRYGDKHTPVKEQNENTSYTYEDYRNLFISYVSG